MLSRNLSKESINSEQGKIHKLFYLLSYSFT
jgi:hypothetical protein